MAINPNYFFNDQYDDNIVLSATYQLANAMYTKSEKLQNDVLDTSLLHIGNVTEFDVYAVRNELYDLPTGTYSYELPINFIPQYSKKLFLDRYGYHTPVSAHDIAFDSSTFAKRLILQLGPYVYMNYRIIFTFDTMIICLYTENGPIDPAVLLGSTYSSDMKWTLSSTFMSDIYFISTTKINAITTNGIPLSIFTEKKVFDKEHNNTYLVYLSTSQNTIDLLFTSSSTLVEVDGVYYFTISDKFRSFIGNVAGNTKIYIMNDFGKSASYIYDGTTSTLPVFQFPYTDTTPTIETIGVYVYDNVNDIRISKLNAPAKTTYPNIYDYRAFSEFTGNHILLEVYEAPEAYSRSDFDNNLKEYLSYRGVNYLNDYIADNLPDVISSYTPLAPILIDYVDYQNSIYYEDKDVRGYFTSKLISILKDNSVRYHTLSRDINIMNRNMIIFSGVMSNYPNIYNRSILSTDDIGGFDGNTAFASPVTYFMFSNSILGEHNAYVFINGKRIIPTNIITNIDTTYVFIDKSLLDESSRVLIEMPIASSSTGINKTTDKFIFSDLSTLIEFPGAALFEMVASNDLIFYDFSTNKYIDRTRINYSILEDSLYIDTFGTSDSIIFGGSGASLLITELDKFFKTQALLYFELGDDTRQIDLPEGFSFNKKVVAKKLQLSTSDPGLVNIDIGVTNTDNWLSSSIDLSVSQSIVLDSFTEDPDPTRFNVYVNGNLISPSSTSFTYDQPEFYGDNATFTFTATSGEALVDYVQVGRELIFDGVVPSTNLINDIISMNVIDYSGLDNWAKVDVSIPVGINSIAYGFNKYVAVGENGLIASSVDAKNWNITYHSSGTTLDYITFINNTLYIVGENGIILTSTDGTLWNKSTYSGSDHLSSIAYGNGKYVIVGYSGTIITSTDAITWTKLTTTIVATLYDIAYGGNTFAAVGFEGIVITSTNGEEWTSNNESIDVTMYGIEYGNDEFVTVGFDGSLYVSADSVTWTKRPLSTASILENLTYSNGEYVVVGQYGTVLTSTNGIDWITRTFYDNSTLTDVIAGIQNIYVAVGSGGALFTTSDIIIPPALDVNTMQVYRNGLRVLPEDIIQIQGNNLFKITGYNQGDYLIIYSYKRDPSIYEYDLATKMVNVLGSEDNAFMQYLNTNNSKLRYSYPR